MNSQRKRGERSSERAGAQRLSRFARDLLAEWKRLALPVAGESVIVAVSGGADSVALLLALDELKRTGQLALRLTAAHLDHGLRAEASEEDAAWVAELSRELGVEIVTGRVSTRERAGESGDNLEQAARRARYEFLAGAALRGDARMVLTAHTMDDQAETVLLRLLRGSGADGLGGIEPVRALDRGHDALLVRPLLSWARRAETEGYCAERDVRFRVDEMNRDERFARVRVRKQLLPLMQTFNGRVVEALARTAELLREDAAALRASAEKLLDEAGDATVDASPLSIDVLASAPPALRRRALRLWIARGRGDLRRLEMVHLLGVEKLLAGERGGRVALLPGGGTVKRLRGQLVFDAQKG
ncbi:MAG: tRNA lysidine(34) synthetase TilS [Pyrinomonadaceae bacterium]